jgi:predicted metal-dependent phosphoesterase TrpH
MVRVDLHTHSQASPDGGLSANDYRTMLKSGKLQTIAITDHNRIDFAVKLHEELGDAIIIGEEIAAIEGEVIGLFLSQVIPAGLSAKESAIRIHAQGGLVYVPHPFETARKGLQYKTLEEIAEVVDIIEIFNGRTLQDRGGEADTWATDHSVLRACSSDAHGRKGWGNTASFLNELPERETLLRLLNDATHNKSSTGLTGRLYPKFNRLKVWRHYA